MRRARVGEFRVRQADALQVRQVRAELSVEPGARIAVYLDLADAGVQKFISEHAGFLQSLARLGEVHFKKPDGKMIRVVLKTGDIYLDLAANIDIAREKARIEKEIQTIEKGKQAVAGKLNSPQFAERAPADLVEAEKQKLAEYNTRLDALAQMLTSLTG